MESVAENVPQYNQVPTRLGKSANPAASRARATPHLLISICKTPLSSHSRAVLHAVFRNSNPRVTPRIAGLRFLRGGIVEWASMIAVSRKSSPLEICPRSNGSTSCEQDVLVACVASLVCMLQIWWGHTVSYKGTIQLLDPTGPCILRLRASI